jgi:site-specific recombinase XerD
MDIEILAQQFYDYSLHIRGYSKETVRRYKYVINSYRQYTGIKNINEVSNENVRSLLFYGRTQKKWQVNTYIVFYKSLVVFFRWCRKEGYLKDDPMKDIEVPALHKRIPPKLSKEDALRLLDVVYNYPTLSKFIRYRNHAIFAIFIYAGLRKSELLHLKFTDVDLTGMSLFIRQGKGGKDRIVPISFTLAQILKRYLEERMKSKKTCPEFFTSSTRNMGFTDSGIRNLVVRIRAASGMRFSVHKLRHTFATLMLEGGCDIYSLSKMMGHSDINTTTIYLAASAEHLRNQIIKHPMNDLQLSGI